jgi:uncharacterized protein
MDAEPLEEPQVGEGDTPQFTGAYLFITNRCNLRCGYCYVPQQDPQDISPQVVRWTLDFLVKHSGAQRRLGVALFGGEPLLVWEATRAAREVLAEGARRYGKRVGFTLVTNGLLLTPDRAQDVIERNGFIHISFDGPDDSQRCFANGQLSFPRLLEALRGLREVIRRRPDRFLARVALGKHNLDVVKTVRAAADLGFRQVHLEPVSGDSPSAVDAETVPAVRDALLALADWLLAERAAGRQAPTVTPLSGMADRMADGPCVDDWRPCCQAGRSQLAVGQGGELYFCNGWYRDPRFQVGQLPGGLFAGALDWVQAAERQARAKCGQCDLRHFCASFCWKANLQHTGSLGSPDPLGCEIANAFAAAARVIAGPCRDLAEGPRWGTFGAPSGPRP